MKREKPQVADIKMTYPKIIIDSQDKLNPCNDGKRSSEVLLSTIDELEKVKKENEVLKTQVKALESLVEVYKKYAEESDIDFIKKMKIARNMFVIIFVLSIIQLILEFVK